MSLRSQAVSEGFKEPSLRLLKQKVKRGAAQIDITQQSILDGIRNEDEDAGRQQVGKSYALLSPQPPQHSRSEDNRYISRFHEPSQGANNGKSQSHSNGALDVATNDPADARQGKDSSGEVATVISPNQAKDDAPIDMWMYEVGLDNLGNTCFMNSVLQCLLHVEPLVRYFVRTNIESHLNLASPKKGALAVAFKQLVTSIYKRAGNKGGSVSPAGIQKAVGAYAPYLMDLQQQDSQEFLRFLLDGMSEDLCRKHSELGRGANASTERDSKADLRGNSSSSSAGHAGILPILPGSVSSPNVADFARISISAEKGSPTLVSMSACNSPVPGGHYRAGAVSASQRLRDETRAMRQTDFAASGAGQPIQPLPLRLKNNNQGEEEIIQQNIHTPTRESTSKYVNRLRKQRSEASTDEAETPHNAASRSSDEVQAFSPLLASAERASRDVALLRSADDAEDFSTGEDNSPTISPAKGHRDSLGAFSHDPCEEQEQEQASYTAEVLHKRIPRKSPAAHRHPHARNSSTGAEDLASMALGSASEDGASGGQLDSAALAAKEARQSWDKYLKLNDSIITDIFAGQLQSTIECLTCHHRSSTYDPFLDLSVPIYRESEGGSSRTSFLGTLRNTVSGGGDSNKSTLEKCLEKFTAEEVLDGDNMYLCEKCRAKRKSVKQLSIYKYPQVLVIHIKRFKYNSTRREKLSTDVHFPLSGLDLSPFVSRDARPPAGAGAGTATAPSAPGTDGQSAPLYDLIGVSNHHGSLHSGHYIAHVDTTGGRPDRARRWMCFNDSRVSAANANGIAGPTAYVLFYKIHEQGAT